MSELGDSLIDVIRKRTTSAAFGTYIFFWASMHWQGIYTSVFVSDNLVYKKFGLLKNEYLNKYFFGAHNATDWAFYAGYLVPLILTAVFIWPLPKFILIHIYRIEQEHKTDRIRVKSDEERKRQAFAITGIRQESATIAAKAELSSAKKSASTVDPTIVWDDEYNKFQRDPAFQSFTLILQAVYEHEGNVKLHDAYGERVVFDATGGALMIADTYGLVEISANGTKIKLTKKGKYFEKRYPQYGGR